MAYGLDEKSLYGLDSGFPEPSPMRGPRGDELPVAAIVCQERTEVLIELGAGVEHFAELRVGALEVGPVVAPDLAADSATSGEAAKCGQESLGGKVAYDFQV